MKKLMLIVALMIMGCSVSTTPRSDNGNYISTHVDNIGVCDTICEAHGTRVGISRDITTYEDAWNGTQMVFLEPIPLTVLNTYSSGEYSLSFGYVLNTNEYSINIEYVGNTWTFLCPQGNFSMRLSDNNIIRWNFDNSDCWETDVTSNRSGIKIWECYITIVDSSVIEDIINGNVEIYRIESGESIVNAELNQFDIENIADFKSICDSLILSKY